MPTSAFMNEKSMTEERSSTGILALTSAGTVKFGDK
jgi:hypothetical protein